MEEEKEKYCPQCWRTMPPDLTYCPFCKVKLEIEPFKRPRLITVAALAATFAACLSIMGGFLSITEAFYLSFVSAGAYVEFPLGMILTFATIAFFDFVGFVFGSLAGTNSWKKRGFRSSVVAVTLLLFVGFINLKALDAPHGGAYGFGSLLALGFGVPIIILSLLSLVFIVIKQKEFT